MQKLFFLRSWCSQFLKLINNIMCIWYTQVNTYGRLSGGGLENSTEKYKQQSHSFNVKLKKQLEPSFWSEKFLR